MKIKQIESRVFSDISEPEFARMQKEGVVEIVIRGDSVCQIHSDKGNCTTIENWGWSEFKRYSKKALRSEFKFGEIECICVSVPDGRPVYARLSSDDLKRDLELRNKINSEYDSIKGKRNPKNVKKV